MTKVLLIEPMYKRAIVPYALMKFSTYYKRMGYEVKYVRTSNVTLYADYKPDIIEITSIFSWDLDSVCEAVNSAKRTFPTAKLRVGGVAATYNWQYVLDKTGIKPHEGLLPELEGIELDYDMFPDIDYSLGFTSRGCIRKCGFCIVHRHEPTYFEIPNWERQINYDKPHIILMDNNFAASDDKRFGEVVDKLVDFGKTVDFNQSLDTRLINDYKAMKLAELKLKPLRFAFDSMSYADKVRDAVALVEKHGINPKGIHYLILYNWYEKPEDAHLRCQIVHDELQGVPFAMRYNPLDSLKRDDYVGEHWTRDEVEKFKAYWNLQRITKSCTYEEFKYKKHENKIVEEMPKTQKRLW